MSEFIRQDWSGSRFEEVDFSRSWFHNVYLEDAVLRGAWLRRVAIDGEVDEVTINGVDVVPYVEAELDRRHPDRARMRPTTADGFREAWAVLERLWSETTTRARELPEARLHERVDGEWSFVETLRHLVFATDAWVRRAYLGEPAPYHRFGLPHTEMPADTPGVPHATADPALQPTLEEVLAVRVDRMATVRRVLEDLTDERLASSTEPVLEPGYPESESFPVRRCLGAVISEEWHHRLYAERDLDVLEALDHGPAAGGGVTRRPAPPPRS